MKRLVRFVAIAAFIGGMLAFYVIPRNRYAWMTEMDPSITPASVTDPSGDSLVFTVSILAAIFLTQLLLFAMARSRQERAVPVVMALLAGLAWFWKFG